MKTKGCTKCKIRKLINQFSKTHVSKDGLYSQCKKCTSAYSKKYYQKNKQQLLEKRTKYVTDNREKVLEGKRLEYQKNKEKYIINSNKWVVNNRKKSNRIKYNYKIKKRKVDTVYKMTENLRTRIRSVLKGMNKSKTSMELLGCSGEELKIHLEKQFTKGMSWANYGYYGWHIDHIRPCSSFDLSDSTQQKECFHYSNLQPLWAKDNLKKSDNWSYESF
jgi:hypothetical protein